MYHFKYAMRWSKEKFFSFYWILLLLGLSVFYLCVHKFESMGKELVFLGPLLALGYFIHRQKLDESKYFLDMFRRFNERYDGINEKLNEMTEQETDISPKQKEILMDYFNLCSEEYLMFKAGYIPIVVWDSWRVGMIHYLKNKNIEKIFESEMSSDNHDSYYGLSLKIIGKTDAK